MATGSDGSDPGIVDALRVIVVTADEELACSLMRGVWRRGVYVLHAVDVADGLSLCKSARPHVMLMDSALIASEGSESLVLTRAMSGDHVGLLVLALSAGAVGIELPLEARVDGVIHKPLDFVDLKGHIVQLAERTSEHFRTAQRIRIMRGAAEFTARSQGALPPAEPRTFQSNDDVIRMLFTIARSSASGLLRLDHKESMLELTFVRGIVTGARDNLRENQLGERLLRQGRVTKSDLKKVNERVARGERVAEAIVSMGFLDAAEALAILAQQVRERLWRALGWREGLMTFTPKQDVAGGMGAEGVDLQREVMAWALEPVRAQTAEAFVGAHVTERLVRTRDFDDGLLTYGRLRPGSPLKAALARSATMVEVLASCAGEERDLYALWLAGVFRFESEAGRVDDRPLPRPLTTEGQGWAVDRQAVASVAAVTLRIRGRTFYDALDLAPDAAPEVIAQSLNALEGQVGPEALAGRDLGPARQAARELWTLLAEMRATLLVPARRQAYDQRLAPPRPALRPDGPLEENAEQLFLDGQMSLEQGELSSARAAFERALAKRPNDPDFNAWLAWTSILSGDDEHFAIDLLETAARAYPQAMRPQFFLGLAASRRGHTELARRHLEEAVARAPGDLEARRALESVGG